MTTRGLWERSPGREGHAASRALALSGALAAGVIIATVAGCEPGYYYGAGGGVAGPIKPHQAGGFVSLSTRREYEPGRRSMGSYFAAEGTLLGFASTDSRGITPLLLGSGGGRRGPFRLYVEGGVQLLGALERYDHQVFSLFGLVGGVGAGVAFSEQVELHLNGRFLWSSPTTQVEISPATEEREFLYFFGGLTLYLRFDVTPPRPVEDPI